jgi:hypothetical protein
MSPHCIKLIVTAGLVYPIRGNKWLVSEENCGTWAKRTKGRVAGEGETGSTIGGRADPCRTTVNTT